MVPRGSHCNSVYPTQTSASLRITPAHASSPIARRFRSSSQLRCPASSSFSSAVVSLAHAASAASAPAPARPDVLFLAIDDLNDGITLLDPTAPIPTPNLQRLARRGVSFTRAYAASPAWRRRALRSRQRPARVDQSRRLARSRRRQSRPRPLAAARRCPARPRPHPPRRKIIVPQPPTAHLFLSKPS